ncbi:hypothetical protein H261_17738 [Paramagnetospirillum caucaseum]|uniref:Uncharacterized protein n=1 Tax=Paramagnetospirillum caucaseum TaxID=1244869 RepID=M3A703_9PROT|nr:hypothetical protein [Paramagnetospirillum caucaseum]EME68568.1 hypothetical protein H261_17738 [Paramagnetospirillum caucaseum]
MATTSAVITANRVTPVANAGKLLALADVSILMDGVEVVIHGVQVRADVNGTEVTLPKYRAPDGTWMTAISLPDELKGPMGDVVMAAAIEAGILMEKHR